MSHGTREKILLACALVVGAGVTWVDSRPSWDDTGVTVGVILLATFVLGVFGPRRPWLWGLAVGAGIPLVEIPASGNFGAVAALAFALAGAYTGSLARKALG